MPSPPANISHYSLSVSLSLCLLVRRVDTFPGLDLKPKKDSFLSHCLTPLFALESQNENSL